LLPMMWPPYGEPGEQADRAKNRCDKVWAIGAGRRGDRSGNG
jgi:hypothetical protein